MDIKVLVVTHKPYQISQDSVYIPINVGSAKKQSAEFIRDNTGDNISSSNSRFCELTAIYWAWKNLEADYYGFVHYRRYFTLSNLANWLKKEKFDLVMSRTDIEGVLKNCDLILPKKRKYYIETIQSHYNHLPYTREKDLHILENVIKELTPEYEQAFNTIMNDTKAHMFNMFIMKKEYFNQYCEWLFKILFEVDRQIDTSDYTAMEARAVAYLGEFMMDIWLQKNAINYQEMNVIFMEKQRWFKKISLFIFRKISHHLLIKIN